MEEVIFYHKEPTRLLCPWDFPGKNIGVGCRFLLQRIFLTQGSNLCLFHLLHWKAGSLPLTPTGKPQRVLKPVTHEWKNSSKNKWMTSSFSFFNLIFFKWRIIVLQYCVGFCHILTWISHRSIRLLPPETLPSSPSSFCPSPPAVQETPVWLLGREDPLEKSMATHSSILARRIPMDRGAWRATMWGCKESDVTEWLSTAQHNRPYPMSA